MQLGLQRPFARFDEACQSERSTERETENKDPVQCSVGRPRHHGAKDIRQRVVQQIEPEGPSRANQPLEPSSRHRQLHIGETNNKSATRAPRRNHTPRSRAAAIGCSGAKTTAHRRGRSRQAGRRQERLSGCPSRSSALSISINTACPLFCGSRSFSGWTRRRHTSS